MKQVLVTGGTVFVSRYVAEYYVQKGYQVYVLNRNHHVQSKGVLDGLGHFDDYIFISSSAVYPVIDANLR